MTVKYKKLEQKDLHLIQKQNLKRDVSSTIDKSSDDLITMSFASEVPYLRYNWEIGAYYEVISVNEADMNMARFGYNCPLLFNHNFDIQLGSVKKAWIDENEKKAYAQATISSTMQDYKVRVEEGHLTNVSFCYDVTKMVYVGDAEDGLPIYRCNVEVLEVSLVTVPADFSVGIGRSKNFEIIKIKGDDMPKKRSEEVENQDVNLEDEKAKLAKEVEELEEQKAKLAKEVEELEEQAKAEDENTEAETETEDKPVEEEEQEKKKGKRAMADEKKMLDEMKKIAKSAKDLNESDLGNQFIADGKTEVEFLRAVAAKKTTAGSKGVAPAFIQSNNGEKDDVLNVSIVGFLEEKSLGLPGRETAKMAELVQEMRSHGHKASRAGALPLSSEYLRAKYSKTVEDAIKAKQVRADQPFSIAGNAGTVSYTHNSYETLEQLEQKFLAPQIVKYIDSPQGFGTVTWQKKTGQVVSSLINEGQYVDDTNINYDLVTFTSKSAQTSASVTRRARTQSNQDFEYDILRSMIIANLTLRDEQLLRGKGTAVDAGKPFEVLGIDNMTGIKIKNIGDGTAVGQLSYQHLLAMYEELDLTEILNLYSGKVFLAGNARIEAQLRGKTRFANTGLQIMDKPGYVDDMQFVKSSSVKDGKVANVDASSLYMIAEGAILGMNFSSEYQFDAPDRAGLIRFSHFDDFDFQPAYKEGIAKCSNIARMG